MIEFGELNDGVITLRTWRAGDADRVVEILQDPEIPRPTTVPAGYTHAHFDARLIETAEALVTGTDVHTLICDGTDRVLGAISLHNAGTRVPEIGYWVAADARNRGIAGRATRLLSDWALEAFEFERIEIIVRPENLPSLRAAQRAGFVTTGERRTADCRSSAVEFIVLSRPSRGCGPAGSRA